MTSPLAVEVLVGGAEVIDRLADEWRALCEEGRYDAPFYRPEWFAAHMRAFAADREAFIVAARDEGRLVAVLPLVREIGSLGGIPARMLRAPANAYTYRYDLIVHPDSASAAIRAIWSTLLQIPGWDVLEAPNVPHRAAFTRLARVAQSQGHPAYAMRSMTSPYLTLQPGEAGFEDVLRRLDARFRSNLRRRMRRLEALGAVQLVRAAVADALLPHFYELERSGWKGAEGSAIASDARSRRFFDDLSSATERLGHLSLYALECAGRPIAAYYGLTYGSRYFLLKTAYDESLHACSPGQLITSHALRDLTARGCIEFDFLGPLMAWKKDWAPRLRPHSDWYIFRGPTGRVLHTMRFRIRAGAGRLKRRYFRRKAAARR